MQPGVDLCGLAIAVPDHLIRQSDAASVAAALFSMVFVDCPGIRQRGNPRAIFGSAAFLVL